MDQLVGLSLIEIEIFVTSQFASIVCVIASSSFVVVIVTVPIAAAIILVVAITLVDVKFIVASDFDVI